MAKGENASVSGDHGAIDPDSSSPDLSHNNQNPVKNLFFVNETCSKATILRQAGVYGYFMVRRCWNQRFHFKKQGMGRVGIACG